MAEGTLALKLSVEQRKGLQELQKLKSQISGIGKVAGIVGGLVGGIGFMAMAKKAIFTRARNRELAVVMEELGKNAGKTTEEIYGVEKAIKDKGVTTEMARQIIIDFIRSENDLTKATELARTAQNAGVIAMQDTATAMAGIMHGIMVLRPQVLRYHGIVISLEAAYNKFCEATGRTRESLSEIEKQQIALNAVLEYGKRIQGAYTSAMSEAGKRYRSIMVRYIQEALDALGEIGMPILGEFVDLVGDIAQRTERWAEANQQVLKQKVAQWAASASEKIRGLVEWTGRHLGQLAHWGKLLITTAIAVKVAKIAYSIGLAVTALKSLSAASLAAIGPIGLIATAIGAVTALVVYYGTKTRETAKKSNIAVSELVSEYKQLSSQEQLTREEKERLIQITERLNDLLPETTQGILDEAAAAEELGDAYELLAKKEILERMLPKIADLKQRRAQLEAQRQEIQKTLEAFAQFREFAQAPPAKQYTWKWEDIVWGLPTREEAIEQIEKAAASVRGGGIGGGKYKLIEALRDSLALPDSVEIPVGWQLDAEQARAGLTGEAAKMAETAKQIVELEAEIKKAEDELRKLLALPGKEIPSPDEGAVQIAAKAWEDALEDLHEMRLKLIKDEFAKERAEALKEFLEFRDEILQAAQLTEADLISLDWSKFSEDQRKMLSLIGDVYDVYLEQLAQIRQEELEAAKKTAREKAQTEIDALMGVLDYKRRLYAWDTAAYIRALEEQLAAYVEGTEERRMLEEKLQEAIREQNIETAEAQRQTIEDFKRDFASAIASGVTEARNLTAAMSNLGRTIVRQVVELGVKRLLDYLMRSQKEANSLKAALATINLGESAGGLFSILLDIGRLILGAQHGLVVRKPRLVKVGEGGRAEAIAPIETFLRQVNASIHSAMAANQGPPVMVIFEEGAVKAIDAADVQRWIRAGAFRDEVELALARRWLHLAASSASSGYPRRR